MLHRKSWLVAALAAWCAAAQAQTEPARIAARALVDLSLEELTSIVVSSVSRRDEPLASAPSSIYVIGADDIRRSGATRIAEALRLAPNLQVARTGAEGYAITARGFNNPLANKLLVLIDGRTVYTPLFSGVFWEVQDTMIEDIERIEVISGPGGTLWGANAVNGVVNVITKSAARTQGSVGAAGAGSDESLLALRHGGEFDGGHYRIYAKGLRRENASRMDGTSLRDGSDRLQAGFRTDWTSRGDAYTVQGDLYGIQSEQPQTLEGANLLARWQRGELRVQAYYDRTRRRAQELDTLDLEAAHAIRLGSHRILWGGGTRQHRDRIDNASLAGIALLPADRRLTVSNVFVHDEIALREDLAATLGLKLERNSYTGWEALPSARLGWSATRSDFLWAAWSRAVRTPARIDRELFLPGTPPFLLAGGPQFESETSDVYELGYRAQPASSLSFSATAFYHDHQDLRSIAPGAAGATVENDREGHTKGIEMWGAWRATARWRLSAGYTRLDTRLRVRPGEVDLQPAADIGSDPDEWWNFRAALDLGEAWELDLMVRHYGAIANRDVPAYTASDVRLGWRYSRRVELSLLLLNLFDEGHMEWNPAAEMRRSVFLKAAVGF
jgi:iron complex outermembrane receptor protein